MTEEDVRETILRRLAHIAPEADLQELFLRENIRGELDIDSYDFLTLLVGLDEEPGVEIPEADHETLVSLEDLIRYLCLRLS